MLASYPLDSLSLLGSRMLLCGVNAVRLGAGAERIGLDSKQAPAQNSHSSKILVELRKTFAIRQASHHRSSPSLAARLSIRGNRTISDLAGCASLRYRVRVLEFLLIV